MVSGFTFSEWEIYSLQSVTLQCVTLHCVTKTQRFCRHLPQLVMLSGLQILFRDAEVVHVGVQTWIETHEEGTS